MPKRAVNLSIDAALAEEAKSRGVNLSAQLEAALRARIAELKAAEWLEENREAIAAANAELERNGLLRPAWFEAWVDGDEPDQA